MNRQTDQTPTEAYVEAAKKLEKIEKARIAAAGLEDTVLKVTGLVSSSLPYEQATYGADGSHDHQQLIRQCLQLVNRNKQYKISWQKPGEKSPSDGFIFCNLGGTVSLVTCSVVAGSATTADMP